MIRSSDNVQIYPPIDGIKFPWSGEEERGDKKRASEAPTRKVCDLGCHSMWIAVCIQLSIWLLLVN